MFTEALLIALLAGLAGVDIFNGLTHWGLFCAPCIPVFWWLARAGVDGHGPAGRCATAGSTETTISITNPPRC